MNKGGGVENKPVKETEVKPVYVKIRRGNGAQYILLQPFMVDLISTALLSATLKGEMATGGGTTDRTQKGKEQANAIFEFLELLNG